jgi:hypothetical protein
MSKMDEADYGLGVSTVSTGQILARTPVAPTSDPNWQLTSRQINFDGTTLSIGGSTSGTLNLPLTGDSQFEVTALHDLNQTGPAPDVLSQIWYQADWSNLATGIGLISRVELNVGPKIVIRSIDFVDQGVLLTNSEDPVSVRGAVRLPDVEFDQAKSVSYPWSQTTYVPDGSSGTYCAYRVMYSTAGIPTGATITGTVSETGGNAWWNNNRLDYEANSDSDFSPNVNIPPSTIGQFRYSLSFTATIVQPNQPNVSLDLANIPTELYGTLGAPGAITDPKYQDSLKPTIARMNIAARVINTAYMNAYKQTQLKLNPVPTGAQIVFEALKQHVFNLNNSVVGDARAAGASPATSWLVYYFWTHPYPIKGVPPKNYAPGSDCISGAMFTYFVCTVFGAPGTINVKEFTSESFDAVGARTAVEWGSVADDEGRSNLTINYFAPPSEWIDNWGLALWDPTGGANNFEATIVYSDGTNTYYMPSGLQQASLVFGNANDVLSLFTKGFGWGRATASAFLPYTPNPGDTMKYNYATFTATPTPINLYGN